MKVPHLEAVGRAYRSSGVEWSESPVQCQGPASSSSPASVLESSVPVLESSVLLESSVPVLRVQRSSSSPAVRPESWTGSLL